MDYAERISKAKKVLGPGMRIIQSVPGESKRKVKPISSFVERKKSSRRDMNREEYEQCGRKTRYDDEHEARKYATDLSLKRGYPIRAYWCHYCEGYHLTHKPQRFSPQTMTLDKTNSKGKRKVRRRRNVSA